MSKTNEIWSRAAALHQHGKLAEALAAYDAFLRAEPRNAQALHYSGVATYQTGDLGQAFDRMRASVAIDDANPEAWSNLGLVLQAIGHKRAAVDVFEKAVRLDPGSTEVLANLASAQSAWGRHADAEATARRVIAKDGTHAKAWFILALALEPQGRMLEALDAATRAVGFAPALEGYSGLKAQLENGIGAPEKARRTLETALARNPMSTALRFQLAGVLEYKLAELPAAAEAYEQVLRVDPRHGAALSQLAFLRGRLAHWEGRDQLVERYRAGVAASLPLLSPFAFLSLPSTRAEQRQCAQTWTAPLADVQPPAARRRILSPNRLRIGYLSADFHGHATAFLAAGLFEQHDRTRFEIFAYSTGPDDRSPMRARLVKAFDRFVDVRGRDPLAVADAIRGDGVDILVDLKGHTEGSTPIVLALRPAPIQVHYLGYPGTLGGNLVDYLVGDPTVTPVEHAADYAEAIAMLPDSYQVNDRERAIAPAPPRSGTALPDGAFVFVSFNQTYKINPGVFDAWMAILAARPGFRAVAAREGGRRSGDREPAPRSAGARHRRRAHRVRAPSSQRRIPRAVPPRRSLPRHVAVQRAHDGERCAVGRMPGAHRARHDVRRARGGEPPARRRAAGTGDGVDGAVRRAGDRARGGPRRTRAHQRASRGSGARERAVRHRGARRVRWRPPTRPWPSSTGGACASRFGWRRYRCHLPRRDGRLVRADYSVERSVYAAATQVRPIIAAAAPAMPDSETGCAASRR